MRNNHAPLYVAIVAMVYLCIWLPLAAGAQVEPTPTPQFSSVPMTTVTPFEPTEAPTVVPTVAPTPTPIIIQPVRRFYLPLIAK